MHSLFLNYLAQKKLWFFWNLGLGSAQPNQSSRQGFLFARVDDKIEISSAEWRVSQVSQKKGELQMCIIVALLLAYVTRSICIFVYAVDKAGFYNHLTRFFMAQGWFYASITSSMLYTGL
jgi:hypothetical protein